MSNIEIVIVVEGKTEQTFVRDVLAPEMSHKGLYLHAALIGKNGHKGGNICFERAETDISKFLAQRTDTYVSTMFDYFRIDSEWPGYQASSQQTGATLTAGDKAEALEQATHQNMITRFPKCEAETRFIPYIQMHEFEALLFSCASTLASKMEIQEPVIKGILAAYANPEEINTCPEKAPSKRLKVLKKGYRKVVMGKTISKAIGIQGIRKQCPHFNDWLTKLENLAS